MNEQNDTIEAGAEQGNGTIGTKARGSLGGLLAALLLAIAAPSFGCVAPAEECAESEDCGGGDDDDDDDDDGDDDDGDDDDGDDDDGSDDDGSDDDGDSSSASTGTGGGSGPVCGDGVCEGGESCSADCATGTATLVVENHSSWSVWYLFVAPCSSSDWGNDVLGESVLPSGYVGELENVSPGCYDLLAVAENESYWDRYDVALNANGTFTWTLID